jgi:peptide/nickel transport system permease protein
MTIPTVPEPTEEVVATSSRRSWWREALRGNTSAVIGLVMFTAIVLAAVFAPVLAPTDLYEKVGSRFDPPSASHVLGLDDAGQDMITLLLYSTRVTLIVGLGATAIAIVLGAVVGIVAGYVGGRTDGGLMRFTDFFLVIPEVPLMMIIAAVWGQGIDKMVLVIGLILWTWTARVIRAQTKSVRERVYVKRARSLGASNWHTVTRHVLPQVAPLLVVNTVLTFAVAVFDETALSFLGLGDPNKPSLGRMIELASKANAVSNNAWWAIFWPGVLVTLIILSLTLMGTALENSLNPRLRVSHLSRRHFRLARNLRTDREAEAA